MLATSNFNVSRKVQQMMEGGQNASEPMPIEGRQCAGIHKKKTLHEKQTRLSGDPSTLVNLIEK